ncbi:uncharacterized protein LOC122315389, partial [Carya illinoinensis]|uniref:uncharacterized protein LOC122315389 n=1 Tax=Carya illinoinensis TaxID=32201 RepID=UPI001C71CB56
MVPAQKKNLEDNFQQLSNNFQQLSTNFQQFMQSQAAINSQNSQAIAEIRGSVTRLTTTMSAQEKGKFPAQSQPNPQGQNHQFQNVAGDSNVKQVKAITTLRSGKVIGIPAQEVEKNGRPFLATSNALINCRSGVLKLSFGNMTLELNIFNLCRQPQEVEEVHEVNLLENFIDENSTHYFQLIAHWSAQDTRKFMHEVRSFFYDDPYLFKYCSDQIIRKCVPNDEISGVLNFFHTEACGGHFSAHKTVAKILQSGFYWPTMFKDAFSFCKTCEPCQKLGGITRRNMMPMQAILVIEIFDCWGIDFMGPFPSSYGYLYILLAVDYVSKWVEAVPCKSNDHQVVLKFFKENIFARFGMPKAIISDNGTHFCNKHFSALMKKYGIHHKISTPY